MSGGRFNYLDRSLTLEMFDVLSEYGMGDDEYQRNVKRIRRTNHFQDKVISELIYDVMCLIHSYDWYVSDDTDERTYRADVKFFKTKWLNFLDEKRVREIVDGELESVREELLKSLCVSQGQEEGAEQCQNK